MRRFWYTKIIGLSDQEYDFMLLNEALDAMGL